MPLCPHRDTTSPLWICSLSWTMIFLSWFIFTPIICYYGYKLYLYRDHPGIRSRHPFVTGLMIIVCLWFTFIAIPIRYMEGTIHLFREDGYKTFGYVTWVFSISILAFSWVGILRIWLLYFDICWLNANGHKDWSHILNPNEKPSFFLKTKKTFGNDKYIGRYLLIIYIVLCAIYTVTMKYNPYGMYWNILILLCNIPPFTGLFILFYKTPTLTDIFYVRYETKSWIGLSTYILFICLICGPLFYIYGDTHYNVYVQFIFTTSFYVLTIGIPVVSLYLVLHWVIYSEISNTYSEHEDIFAPPKIAILRQKSHSKSSRPRFNRSNSAINQSPKYSRNKSLLALLSDPEGINCFMLHLRKEFAIENLLGLIEIYQFLKVVQKNLDIEHTKLDQCRLILANNVPTSQINTIMDNWRIRLSLLYKKYIIDSAEYQLNLSYGLRSDFISLVAEKIHYNSDSTNSSTTIKNEKEILQQSVFPILCQVMDETIKLLNDSLQRFRQTPEYHRFEMIFNDKSETLVSDNEYPSDNNDYDINEKEQHHIIDRNLRRSRTQKRIKSLISMSSLKRDSTITNVTNMTINVNASSITGQHGLDITTPTITVQTPPITSMVAGNVSTTIPLQLPSFKPCSEDASNDIDNDGSLDQDPGTPPTDDNENVSSQENEVPSMHNDAMNSSVPITDDENEGSFVVLEDLDNIGSDNEIQ